MTTLAAGLIVPLGLLASLQNEGARLAAGQVTRFGVGIDPPDGWTKQIYFFQGMIGPMLRTADFPLPPEHADISGAPPGGVALSLQEVTDACACSGFESVSLPVTVDDSGMQDWGDESVTLRHIEVEGRYFVLFARFGATPVGAPMLNEANKALSTLAISALGNPQMQPDQTAQPPNSRRQNIPPSFPPASNWNTASTGTAPGSENTPVTWAANVPFDARDFDTVSEQQSLPFRPDFTLDSLPADGIVIVATFPVPAMVPAPANNPNFHDRALPLKLSDASIEEAWEGQPNSNVPQYGIRGRIENQYLDLRVYFGVLHPSAEIVREAQAELNRLIVPPAPPAPLDQARNVCHGGILT